MFSVKRDLSYWNMHLCWATSNLYKQCSLCQIYVLKSVFLKLLSKSVFSIFSYILLTPGQCRKDLNYLNVMDASTYLDQRLKLGRVHTGVHGQEVQFFCQNGQLLGTLMWLLQRAEHGRTDDEVKHHQEEDGWHSFPPHDCGPGFTLIIIWGVQHHRFGREWQARFAVVGGRFWVKKVRCSHCENGSDSCGSICPLPQISPGHINPWRHKYGHK